MMTANSVRVWFITGASQGLGLEIARAALAAGDAVVATSRDANRALAALGGRQAQLLVLPLDLHDEAACVNAVRAALERFTRIDVLVNNAGYGIIGALEEVGDDDVRRVFDVNVFGLLRVTRAVLPYMRAQRSGHIVNISSVAGLAGLAGFGVYNGTKFAVEGLSEALAQELAPLGIHVTIVEPGPFRTQFLAGSLRIVACEIDDYATTAGQMRAYAATQDGQQPGDPVKAAVAIRAAVADPEPPLHLILGAAGLARATGKFDALRAEIERWRSVTLAADYDANEPPATP